MRPSVRPLKVCAVNYLNTVPLVWGMMHGEDRERVELSFAIPSLCAEAVDGDGAEIGLAPIAEIARRRLECLPGFGIACRGAVRSILLVSRTPVKKVKNLATDFGSRTSVELARIVLREMYGVEPRCNALRPSLKEMLAENDAALIIGDAALQLDPYKLPYEVLDLGAEWHALTGLPMVFALWAGRRIEDVDAATTVIESSYRYGQRNMAAVVDSEWGRRGLSRDLTDEYLRRYIRHEIGDEEWRGAEAFLELAGLPPVEAGLVEAR